MESHSSEPLLIGGVVALTFILGFVLLRKSPLSLSAKVVKILGGFLGAFLILGGTAKFFEPFKTMFANQIALSESPFPTLSNYAGQFGEISVGITLLLMTFFSKQLAPKFADTVFYLANLVVVIIMLVAVYVHLHPNVPAEVLPLGTKPPYLTVFIMLLAVLSAFLHCKNRAS